MHIVTGAEMVKLDRYAIESVGFPSLVLMENAGREVAGTIVAFREKIRGEFRPARDYGKASPARDKQRGWIVMAGKGNNGGDGLVAARHLREAGIPVEVLYAISPDSLTGDAGIQRDLAGKCGIPMHVYGSGSVEWRDYEGIVDALLGTGSKGAPREPYATMIREANASGLPIVAVDIPSGLDADTGAVSDACIQADLTVTFSFVKHGLLQFPGAENAGRIEVRPIGIMPQFADELGICSFMLTDCVLRERILSVGSGEYRMVASQIDADSAKERSEPESAAGNKRPLWPSLLLPRKADTHKGTYGHVLVAAGTTAMSGAGLLCASAALRAGSGLVTWAVPASIAPHLIGRLPEAMLLGLADGGRGDWSEADAEELLAAAQGKDALVIGPGIGRFAGDGAFLRAVWERSACPLVVDADALNALAAAGGPAAWAPRDAATVLTPHPGEMARLTGTSAREVQADRVGVARRYAVEHGVTLVLKGARTVVAIPDETVYVNVNGNPGMATGGAGDVLAGVLGSLLGQGYTAAQAAALAVYLHGAAGDRAAAARSTPASLIAGDIVEHL